MRPPADAGMSLYGPTGARKYLNAAGRRRFIKAANRAEPTTRLFCLVLGWSGARISEVLALTPARSTARHGAPLAMEPHDRVASRQEDHGYSPRRRHTRHAEGLAAWVRRERLPIECPAASRSTVARSRLTAH